MWYFAFKYWVISIEMPKAILWQKSRTASLLKNEEKISGQALNNSE